MGNFFRKPQPRPSLIHKIRHILTTHFRGIFGFFLPLALTVWQGKRFVHAITVRCMWIWMALSFLFQPVNIPVTGLIPIFILPMAGVMSSAETCASYMTHAAMLMILGGMILLLINNSGFDRRFILWMLRCGDVCQFSAERLLLKASVAGFLMSMFGNRLIAASLLCQYLTPMLQDMQSYSGNKASEPNYEHYRYIIMNAISVACTLGSIAILHAAFTTLAFIAMFYEHPEPGTVYPDIFNYLEYSAFAFPIAMLMLVLHFVYCLLLINVKVKQPINLSSMHRIKNYMAKYENDVPRYITCHEMLSIFFHVFYLMVVFTRWSRYMDMGWAESFLDPNTPTAPCVKDCTIAALFVIVTHMYPKSCEFARIFLADRKTEVKSVKTESGVLWWRFVDKHVNYGYIFLLGAGVALVNACRESGLNIWLAEKYGVWLTDQPWPASVFVVCLISVLFANAMSGTAACVIILPFILGMSYIPLERPPDTTTTSTSTAGTTGKGGGGRRFARAATTGNATTIDTTTAVPEPTKPPYLLLWHKQKDHGSLAVGLGTAFGFMFPFLFTPAYFAHHVGKVPIKNLALYGLGSAILCLLVLFLSITYYAPIVWPVPLLEVPEPTETPVIID